MGYTERMRRLLGDRYEDYLATFDEPPARAFLINTRKIEEADFDALFSFPTTPVPYAPAARRLLSETKVGSDPLHAAGLFYMQDPGAMSAISALPEIGERVLDVAAAPGGKTIAAALASPSSFIVANEINFSRAKILLQNVERLGLTNVAVSSLTPTDLGKYCPETFDTLIADLPCSGEGMFRKEEAARIAWNENINAMNAARQKEILDAVLPALKKGGTLLYSTCTYAAEEDEAIVDYLIKKHGMRLLSPKAEILPYTASGITESFGEDFGKTRRFYPHIAPGEGQFFAVLQKEGESLTHLRSIPAKVSVNELKRIRSFLDAHLTAEISSIVKQGESYYATHSLSRTVPIRYLSEGVRLGELKGDPFLPHQNLFTAYGDAFLNKEDLTLDDPRLASYLYGEEIPALTAKEGYLAVTVCGHTLGGGKNTDGQIKNRYPKGLRNHK